MKSIKDLFLTVNETSMESGTGFHLTAVAFVFEMIFNKVWILLM